MNVSNLIVEYNHDLFESFSALAASNSTAASSIGPDRARLQEADLAASAFRSSRRTLLSVERIGGSSTSRNIVSTLRSMTVLSEASSLDMLHALTD